MSKDITIYNIRNASYKELEKMQDELFSYPVLTDYQLYLYEMIDKRLTSFERIK